MRYFWYSNGQAAVYRNPSASMKSGMNHDGSDFTYHQEYKPLLTMGTEGKFKGIVHEYTEVTDGPKPSGAWPDYALVAVIGPDTPIKVKL
jgi:hypothetical protein